MKSTKHPLQSLNDFPYMLATVFCTYRRKFCSTLLFSCNTTLRRIVSNFSIQVLNLRKNFDFTFISDTDSMCISFTSDIDQLVKPSKISKWPSRKRKHFVIDETNPLDLRYPGKWKQEFSTQNGAIIM